MTDGRAMYKVTFRQRSMHQMLASGKENGGANEAGREGTSGVTRMDFGCFTIEGEFGSILDATDLLSEEGSGGGDDLAKKDG